MALDRVHFHHKMVHVSDIQRSEDFFRQTLGLDFVGHDLWPGEGHTATFKTQIGQYVVLVEVPEVDASRAEHWNFMLTAEDFADVQKRLQDYGCAIGDLRAEFRAVGEISDNYYDPDSQMMQITAIGPEAYECPPARAGKVIAGRIEDFPIGSVTRNEPGKFYLVRTADGVLALSEICTHRQGEIQYEPEHYRFYCPVHHNRFSRTGKFLGHQPGSTDLRTYAIEFVDGQIVVDTDVALLRKPGEAKKMVPIPETAQGVPA